MKPQIALITILTDNTPRLAAFYRDVLGFPVKQDLGGYVEFESPGVRFSICTHQIMSDATAHPSYQQPRSGQQLELAFPCENPQDVDESYQRLIAKGATPITPPADMPWGQRTAFFADPDGNIHELFADLPAA
jgi:catechol 2,3-dioxygenase-like lactoylglutathione lyase family enzyme